MRFLFSFLVLFSAMQIALTQSGDSTVEQLLIDHITVAPAGHLIGALYPEDGVRAIGRRLVSSRARLNVRPGCEGIELYLLMIAGVLAFPASWRHRLVGLAVGVSAAFALNQLRMLALYTAARDYGEYFDLMHAYLAPITAVALLMVVFGVWVSRVAAGPEAT